MPEPYSGALQIILIARQLDTEPMENLMQGSQGHGIQYTFQARHRAWQSVK